MAERDKIVHDNFRIKLLPKIKIFLRKKKKKGIDEGYILTERVNRAFDAFPSCAIELQR